MSAYTVKKEYEGVYVVLDDEGERAARIGKFMPGPMVSVSGNQGLYPPALAKAVAIAMTRLADELTQGLRRRTVFEPCAHHGRMYAEEPRRRRAEAMAEGGWGGSPCPGARCRMKPGTDFFTADFVAENPVYEVEQ